MNPRLPYRELADKLDLSVNAVHRRIQEMTRIGVIRAFTAKPTVAVLNGLSTITGGSSRSNDIEKTCLELGSHESTYWVSVAGGNQLYVGGYLRSINDLQGYSRFIKEMREMPDLVSGICPS